MFLDLIVSETFSCRIRLNIEHFGIIFHWSIRIDIVGRLKCQCSIVSFIWIQTFEFVKYYHFSWNWKIIDFTCIHVINWCAPFTIWRSKCVCVCVKRKFNFILQTITIYDTKTVDRQTVTSHIYCYCINCWNSRSELILSGIFSRKMILCKMSKMDNG